jgi:hypothetical protein
LRLCAKLAFLLLFTMSLHRLSANRKACAIIKNQTAQED